MILSHQINGRLGNHCLQIYKTFLFALKRNIPFESIVFDKGKYNLLFENIKSNFVDQQVIDNTKFTIILKDRIDLDDIKFSNNDNIIFQRYNWVYSNSPNEFRLFNYLFDSPTLHEQVLQGYDWLYRQQTIGFPIRRGDFVEKCSKFRVFPEDELIDMFGWLIDKTLGQAKIVVTSDDINWCKSTLKQFEKNLFFIQDTPEKQIMILSFCDQVINNGAVYRSVDHITDKFESTFGQIAQCLCISRHFLKWNPITPSELWSLKW